MIIVKEIAKKPEKKNIVQMFSVLVVVIACICIVVLLCDFFDGQKRTRILEEKTVVDGPIQILVLGDSIWDLERGEDGIAKLLERELNGQAVVHNLAIKGSRAAAVAECITGGAAQVTPEKQQENRICLYSMMQYLAGDAPCDIPKEYEAAELISEVDIREMDYLILAYGLNDYFGAVQQKNLENGYDPTTYAGSMCASIKRLKEVNPELEVIVVSPTYCQGYSYGRVIHESTSHDYGSGTGYDYAMTAKEVAASFDAVFVNNYEDLGISIHNGAEYLIDATHLSESGRRLYAKNLAKYLVNNI